jgi:hypothetical protein
MWPFWIVTFPSVSDIPITPNGKLHVQELIDKCQAILGQKSNTPKDEKDISENVVQIWSQALPNLVPENFQDLMTQHFLTLGGSSLSVMWCVEKIITEIGMYLHEKSNYH